MPDSIGKHASSSVAAGSFLESMQNSFLFRYEVGGLTVVQKDHCTGWRSHPSTIIAQHVGGSSLIEFADGSAHRVEPGQCACIRAGLRHRITKTSPEDSLSRWVHAHFLVFGVVDLFGLLELPVVYPIDMGERLGGCCEELVVLHHAAETNLLAALRERSLGLALACTLLEGASPNPHHSGRFQAVRRLEPVLQYIESNIARPISIPELARLLKLSPPRLHVLFKEALGCSPGQFIGDHRMRHANQLLVGQDMPIKDVAAACGYDDPFHFSRLFKVRFAVSPLRYRELSRR